MPYGTFLHSPFRTGRATFTAPGSPGINIPLPSDYSWCSYFHYGFVAPSLLPVWNSPGSRLFYIESVNSLASFPMWTAFPSSEYYDASDAHIRHRQTACLSILVASHVHKDELYKIT